MSEYNGNYSPSVPSSTLAIIALVAGILGLTFIPLVGSIVAVFAGPMAKREIAESGGTLSGENLAQIGMILGWIGLALSLCGICFVIAAFGFSFLTFLAIGIEEYGMLVLLAL